jgi:hypothetical protein
MKKIIIYFIIGLVILIIGLSPIICTASAGFIANVYGCTLHEGFKNPCIINGTDYGDTLYTMGMMGWLAIGTLPITAGLLLIWLLVGLFLILRSRLAKK